jgi:hypothetical protein
MNPIAIIFWALCGLVGYLIGDGHGAVIGLTAGLSVSFLVSFLDEVG